ncbi:uncharacterized protein [Diabrotica undecimpunctata]|uniref:uncharacterized protein n=1 Tax=Diabrotica undecimpunctata TaxID=50387 RepID=UPI003B6385E6
MRTCCKITYHICACISLTVYPTNGVPTTLHVLILRLYNIVYLSDKSILCLLLIFCNKMTSRVAKIVELALMQRKTDSSIIDHQKESSTSTSEVILSTESISNVSRLQSELPSTSGTAKMFSDASNNDSESERDPFENSSESYVPSDSELSSDEDQIMEEPLEQHREELAQQNNKTKKRKQGNKFLWKRSIVKRNRLSGKKYINSSGKTVEEKKPLPVNCTKCRYT